MGTFAKRDIVIFPFPYTDLSKRKIRPCLVISNEFNQDILLCQITSQNIKKDKYSIEIKSSEVIEGELQINSFARCN
ncbi:MAG: type II toxin-antitoxin system PemK/MazF family toxin, partial [Candidatus Woesearchaeota archaeon]